MNGRCSTNSGKVFLVAFLFGGVTGFFAGVLYSKKRKKPGEEVEKLDFEVVDPNEDDDLLIDISKDYRQSEEFRDYAKNQALLEYRGKVDEVSTSPPDDIPNREPFEISLEEFRNEYPDSNEETLTWYRYDEVLADPSDIPVPNQMDIIGGLIDVLNTTEKDVIYIHSDEFDTNYEVIIEPFAPFQENPYSSIF